MAKTVASSQKQVACPGCGGKQPARSSDAIYWCEKCLSQFDAEGDDGGDFFSDPTKRIELEDERRVQRQSRMGARINGR
jgi:ribosomal protein L37AE/L43A